VGGGLRLNGIFTAMSARRLHHHATVCVQQSQLRREGVIDFVKRNPPLKPLEGLLTSGFLTYVGFWSYFQQQPGRISRTHGVWNKFRKTIE